MSASCLYEGTVAHRRFVDAARSFSYPIHLYYLDLAELPELLDGSLAFSARRPAPVRFRREDYLGDPGRPLRDEVLDLVAARTGGRPAGPVRLLTQLRTIGVSFNPVSFYFCFDRSDEQVEAVVAEVTNTPWGERHAYVLGRGESEAELTDRHAKRLHVSPFLGADSEYEWRVSEPGERLTVQIESRGREGRRFAASMALERRPLDARGRRRILLRHPAAALVVLAQIYAQALRLWLRGATHHPHPVPGHDRGGPGEHAPGRARRAAPGCSLSCAEFAKKRGR